MLGTVMPFWYIGSLILSAIWAVVGRHHHVAILIAAFAFLATAI